MKEIRDANLKSTHPSIYAVTAIISKPDIMKPLEMTLFHYSGKLLIGEEYMNPNYSET